MKNVNTYYTNKEELASFINDEKIQNSSSLLIQVFSAFTDKTFISTLLSELTMLLPDAIIIGSTTDGEIMNGKVSSAKVVLSFTQFKNTTLKTAFIEHQDNGYHSGQYLAKELIVPDTKLFISFVDGLHTNGEEFLNGINSVNTDVIVAGGHAGDNNHFKKTFVFTKDHICTEGAVAVTLNSHHLHVHRDYSFNWKPIGNELTITKAEGNRVYTIDGKSAVDTYAYYLGEDLAKGLPHIGIEFPLIVNRNGLNISRATISKEKDGSLIVAGNLYTGEKVRIGYGNSKEILKRSQNILDTTSKKPSEGIFIYSCMTRRYFMGDEVESEVMPLQQIAPVSGFFTYGEFFTSKNLELFNQTMTLISLSESDEVRNTPLNREPHQTDINSASIQALTYLINKTSEKMGEQTQALKESNTLNQELKERMELALMGSNDGVWDWNIIDSTLYLSPRWKEMLGYNDDEIPNEFSTWEKRLHPDDAEETWVDINKNLNGETEFYENIHRLKHKDGHWVWIQDRGKVQFDEDGKAVRMIGTHTDITEQKANQLKFAEQTKMLEESQRLAHIGSWKLNHLSNTLNWSDEVYRIFEVDHELQPTYELFIQMIHPDDRQKVDIVYKGSLKDQKPYKVIHRLLMTDGRIKFINEQCETTFDHEGKPLISLGTIQDITERKKAEDALLAQKEILRYQAQNDALTGLPNRLLFTDRLEQGIEKSKRHKEGLALFFIDLDKFKYINDSLGHGVGDKVLKIVAKRLENIIRKEDTLARLSGDEFTLIMEELKHPEDVSLLAEKVLQTLSKAIFINEHILYISGSIGITLYPQDATDAQSLLKYADTAMYKAKEEGRNNYQFYSPQMTEFALNRMIMQTSLRQAIDNQEFLIHYQPQMNAMTNTLVGLEALVRWDHPTMGLLPPDTFLPIAEETSMIVEIDNWVMQTAMKQVAQWYKEGLNPGVLGLNLSVKQLDKLNFLQTIEACIQTNDFNSEWLEFEITEGQMMRKPEEVITKLNQINDLGIGISIDDFGTGYSSLSLLKRLPINRLKIDRSFVKDIPEDEEDVAIVKAIIALAKSLKLDLIAEGVETSEQKGFLVNHGCMNIQGHYFSHPVPKEEMHTILLSHT